MAGRPDIIRFQKVPPHLERDYREERAGDNRNVMSLMGLLTFLFGTVYLIRNRFFPADWVDRNLLDQYYKLYLSLISSGALMIFFLRVLKSRRWIRFLNHAFLYLLYMQTMLIALLDFRISKDYTALILILLLVGSFFRFSLTSRWLFYSISFSVLALLMLSLNSQLLTEPVDAAFILIFFGLSFFVSLLRENERISYFNIRQELQVQKEHWKNRSYTDILTGLYNRGYYQETMQYLWEGSVRYHRRFSLALIDIDHFKKVNDTLGHDRGDKVLIEMAGILKENSRKSDIISRYGGEEFCIILSDTDLEGAAVQMNRLRKMIGDHGFPNVPWPVTISIGIANSDEAKNPQQLSLKADKRLYMSKREGRNRVTAMDVG